jgi:hypothetical protein
MEPMDDPSAPREAAPAGRGQGNRLARETSPYLLQHADNPVDWYPWGEEALAAARTQDKPIFLSIGYASCHWCHVMERESFQDQETAAIINREFIPVKVDREERPDLDQLYLSAVVAMTGSGGWPLTVFLTPDGRPFYGGTYFPPEPRGGLPSLRQVLAAVSRAWREQRPEVEQAGSRIVAAILEAQQGPPLGLAPDRALAEEAVAVLARSFDRTRGGWGGAPKFPQPMVLEFLLAHLAGKGQPPLVPGRVDDPVALEMVVRTLEGMAAGGIHDQLAGGFHRYATDAGWLVPHFEKMLSDNAQLARVYLHAWQLTGRPDFGALAMETLDYLLAELRTPQGGFAASQDADTAGVEGATYTWRAEEVAAVLGDAGLADLIPLVALAYGISPAGNWEGVNVLARVRNDREVAGIFGLPEEEVAQRLAAARTALLAARRRRPQPARDDKLVASWNGLAVIALADAAAALSVDPRSEARTRGEEYRRAAVEAGLALRHLLVDEDGRVGRSWRAGRRSGPGILEDHAAVGLAFLSLYELTLDEAWFGAAQRTAEAILAHFRDPRGGFYDVADDQATLVARLKDPQDNAVPSGGSLATTLLLRLEGFTGNEHYGEVAREALSGVASLLARYPLAFGQWLVALLLAAEPLTEVAIVGDLADPATGALLEVVRSRFRPRLVLAAGPDPEASSVPLLGGRFRLAGRPTAFVCRQFACRQPVTEPQALATLLEEDPRGG